MNRINKSRKNSNSKYGMILKLPKSILNKTRKVRILKTKTEKKRIFMLPEDISEEEAKIIIDAYIVKKRKLQKKK